MEISNVSATYANSHVFPFGLVPTPGSSSFHEVTEDTHSLIAENKHQFIIYLDNILTMKKTLAGILMSRDIVIFFRSKTEGISSKESWNYIYG